MVSVGSHAWLSEWRKVREVRETVKRLSAGTSKIHNLVEEPRFRGQLLVVDPTNLAFFFCFLKKKKTVAFERKPQDVLFEVCYKSCRGQTNMLLELLELPLNALDHSIFIALGAIPATK